VKRAKQAIGLYAGNLKVPVQKKHDARMDGNVTVGYRDFRNPGHGRTALQVDY
jgi:hypothetical protein